MVTRAEHVITTGRKDESFCCCRTGWTVHLNPQHRHRMFLQGSRTCVMTCSLSERWRTVSVCQTEGGQTHRRASILSRTELL